MEHSGGGAAAKAPSPLNASKGQRKLTQRKKGMAAEAAFKPSKKEAAAPVERVSRRPLRWMLGRHHWETFRKLMDPKHLQPIKKAKYLAMMSDFIQQNYRSDREDRPVQIASSPPWQ